MKFILSILTVLMVVLPPNALTADSGKTSLQNLYQRGRIECIDEVTIDLDSMPDNLGYKLISDFAFSENNDAFFADSTLCNVFVFSDSGTFKRVFGQKGDGPGDLSAPKNINRLGSEIIVWEILTERLSVFSAKGDFIRIVKPGKSLHLKNISGIPGELLAVETELIDQNEKEGKIFVLGIYNKKLELQKTIFKQPVKRYRTITSPMRIQIDLPFTPDVAWDSTNKGIIVFGAQNNTKITIYKVGDSQQSTFNCQSTATKITEEDRKRVYSDYQMVGPDGPKDAPKALLEQIPFPPDRPHFGKLLIDPEGNILVFQNKSELTEKYEFFDAYTPVGKYIKRVYFTAPILAPLKMDFDQKGFLWFLTYNDSEEIALKKYRLK